MRQAPSLYSAIFAAIVKKDIVEIKPDQGSPVSKKEQVEQMFDSIAGRYDLLNRLLSLGIDKGWRKKAINAIKPVRPKQILDVATGTGDLAIAALAVDPDKVTGIDLSEQMLEIGRNKIAELKLGDRIQLLRGDSENLRFESNKFDAVTVAFGVRNFGELQKGINEMHRVLKPGGMVAVLEFSKPKMFPVKSIYNLYFRFVLPFWGKMISKNEQAYSYLPESVLHFPEGKEFVAYLETAGFTKTNIQPLTFGICTLYTAVK